jgi:hypothetical protein
MALRERSRDPTVTTERFLPTGGRPDDTEERTMATKDKGGGKASKKPAQHNLKEKRKAKKSKKTSSR